MRKLLISFVFIIFIMGCSNESAEPTNNSQNGNSNEQETESNNEDDQKEAEVEEMQNDVEVEDNTEEDTAKEEQPVQTENTFNEETALSILEKYNGISDRLKEEVDFDTFHEEYGYPFHDLTTKKEFSNLFRDFIQPEIVEELLGDTLVEGEGKLYVVPMDGIPVFDKNATYAINQIDDDTHQLVSNQEDELHGKFSQTFIFSKTDDSWIISDVSFEFEEVN